MTIAPLTFPKSFYGDFPPALPVAAASPLSPAHLAELQRANARSKKIRRALRVAQADAWLMAIFAGLTLLCSIFSVVGFLLGLALALCAWNSFRGVERLKHFDTSGPRLLALNQLALAAVLIAYAAWCIGAAAHGHSALGNYAASDPALASALAPFQSLEWLITLAIYGGLIIGTLFAQGLAAFYYATRKKHLTAYLAQTPPWIIEVQKAQLAR